MEIKLLKLLLFKMTILSLKVFMKDYYLKKDTMKESELQWVYSYPIYPRDSQRNSDKGFISIDDGSQGGTHWCCFILKDNKSFYNDSFGIHPDKFLLNQSTKSLIYHNYKIQDINSKLSGSYCFYFLFLIEIELLWCHFWKSFLIQ